MARYGWNERIVTIAEAISSFMKQSGLTRKMRHDSLGRAWCEIIGVDLAEHTRLSRKIDKGVLRVEVDSSALLAELSGLRKTEIIRELNEKVKSIYIEDVRFRLGSNF